MRIDSTDFKFQDDSSIEETLVWRMVVSIQLILRSAISGCVIITPYSLLHITHLRARRWHSLWCGVVAVWQQRDRTVNSTCNSWYGYIVYSLHSTFYMLQSTDKLEAYKRRSCTFTYNCTTVLQLPWTLVTIVHN